MLKYLRWRNWAFFEYNSITENVFLFFYLILRSQYGGFGLIGEFLLFYLFSAVSTSFGYFVNDLGDRDLDRLHKKPNVFESDSGSRSVTVVVTAALLSIISGAFFFKSGYFAPLYILWFFLTSFYSLPPIRFKERGLIGLMAVVPAQRIIPALLLISVFGRFDQLDWIVVVVYTAIRGLMSDVHHQIQDYHHDRSTNTTTCVVRSGIQKGTLLFKTLQFCNLLGQIVLYVTVALMFPEASLVRNVLSAAAGLYVVLLAVYFIRHRMEWYLVNPYSDIGMGNLLHVSLPTFYFPILLMVLHAMSFPSTSVLLMLFLVGKKTFTVEKLARSLPWRILSAIYAKIKSRS